MSVATTTAIGIAAGVGVAGSVAGAAISANAAGNASNAQVNAANQAANLQHQDAQAALDQNNAQFQTNQNNLAPWLTIGRSGLANLAYQLGILPPGATTAGTPGTPSTTIRVPSGNLDPNDGDPNFQGDAALTMDGAPNIHSQLRGGQTFMDQVVPGTPGTPGVPLSSLVNPNLGAEGSLMTPWTEQFQAPTNITEQNDPGYQARLQAGQDAIQRSAAARGGLLTGGTAKDLNDWTQNTASQEYGNVYNRAFNDYTTRYNTFKQNQADQFNRLSSLAGTGQTTASQLGTLGANNAAQNTNILLTSGQQIGQDLNNAGAARASGYAAAGNAYGSALGGIGNNLTSLYFLSKMPGFGGTPAAANPDAGIGVI